MDPSDLATRMALGKGLIKKKKRKGLKVSKDLEMLSPQMLGH